MNLLAESGVVDDIGYLKVGVALHGAVQTEKSKQPIVKSSTHIKIVLYMPILRTKTNPNGECRTKC